MNILYSDRGCDSIVFRLTEVMNTLFRLIEVVILYSD